MRQKLDYIDAIRGVAILMVILTHVNPISLDILPIVSSLSAYGRMGVQLFFIASAITLCLSMQFRAHEGLSIPSFYIRRFFRIAPAYYIGIVGYTAFFLSNNPSSEINFVAISLHFLFLHGFTIEAFMNVVPGGWSIAVEFLFYFTFPYLYSNFVNRKSLRPLLILSVIAFFLSQLVRIALAIGAGIPEDPWEVSYWNFANQLIVFIVGMITYRLLTDETPIIQNRMFLLFVFLFFTLFSMLLYKAKPPLHAFFIVLFSSLSFAALVKLFSVTPALCPLILRRIGQASFSMYLIHFAVIELYKSTSIYKGLNWEPHIEYFINYTVIVVLTFLASWVTYTYIEKPGMQIGKKISKRMAR